ncbi:indoleamine 2,3-dioxygenase 1 isoform X2 [Chiloscyllium plagiosum]|uniref:indoleamine 2,3-dioxygenase 1 isoform X2 n=1 Tax=Chiloscyllium plagiosum TaxID=36176 RepID=UPI001CB83C95|nr:indoleamine 2,3-dioxygenase 1 isoform X2 [Chiloscyllium plagiosum]
MNTEEGETRGTNYISLDEFNISKEWGFVLPNPLSDLPKMYQPWMEIANNLTHLIEHHQLRCEVNNVLPKSLAVPYCEVSKILGLPPILVHADCVLTNWKKKDANGTMELRNLDIIFKLPGGDSIKGFFLVTLKVELAAVQGIKAISIATEAILRHDDDSIKNALHDMAESIRKMNQSLKKMDEYVDPETFYGIIRLFLSGWKDNPAFPEGLLYEGVWDKPQFFSGGSAAQSSTLQSFDEFLRIRHEEKNAEFLYRMRDYMPPSHKAFLQAIASGPSVREHIMLNRNPALRELYNDCIAALVDLRNYHITVVTRYITITAAKAKAEKAKQNSSALLLQKAPAALAERGTGGSGIMCLLKSVRDATKKVMIDNIW